MSQRTLAGLLAVPLLAALWLAALFTPLPFVVYSPGVTVDVLGEVGDSEVISVAGAPAYDDTDGELRLTTVNLTRPKTRVNLFEVVVSWLDRDQAVVPYEAVYPEDYTREDSLRQGQVQMATSQEQAVVVALRELGHDVGVTVEVVEVVEGAPADGVLEAGDQVLRVEGKGIDRVEDVSATIDAAFAAGEPIEMVVRRAGAEETVRVVPEVVDGTPRVGISVGEDYVLPFDVQINLDEGIGGSSAGLVFALAVYDRLTPGSLTDGEVVAGSGTIDSEGRVGSIGGISQKIAAARDAGATLFLVPPGNCDEAADSPVEDVRLVRADTMRSALDSLVAWSEDRDAELPTCERSS